MSDMCLTNVRQPPKRSPYRSINLVMPGKLPGFCLRGLHIEASGGSAEDE